MSLNTESLSTGLQSAIQNTDFSSVQAAATQSINNFDAAYKTVLGSTVGEVQGGIEAISQEVDDAEEALAANQVPTVGRVTPDVPGIGSDLIEAVGDAAADITAMTGSATAAVDGFLQDITTATNPEAVSAALSRVTGKSTQELKAALEQLTLPNLRAQVTEAIDNLPFADFQSQINTYIDQLNEKIQINSGIFLADLGEKLGKNFETSVLALVDTLPNSSEIKDAFSRVAGGDYETAFKTIRDNINVPEEFDFITANFPRTDWPADITAADLRINEAEAQFRVLSVEVSSYADPYSPGSAGAGTNSTGVSDVTGPGARTGASSSGDSWNFDDIGSVDELEAIFRSINRRQGQEVSGAIIHWSATFLDQNVGSDFIHRVHLDRGFAGCGYHIIIRRDGTMQRGRPCNRSGAHDLNNNANFLGFCFIGGIDAYNGTVDKPYWRYASSDSFTPAQWTAYDRLMRTFHTVFPYGQVQGHYNTATTGKTDPGFDVPGYSESKFGHRNVILDDDPRWDSPTAITIDSIRGASN
jgi:hypothetical protein